MIKYLTNTYPKLKNDDKILLVNKLLLNACIYNKLFLFFFLIFRINLKCRRWAGWDVLGRETTNQSANKSGYSQKLHQENFYAHIRWHRFKEQGCTEVAWWCLRLLAKPVWSTQFCTWRNTRVITLKNETNFLSFSYF